ncbi:hypothetical protein [uncultured Methanobrevibacter sp.]|uniref:hypothetical protein n=1 Tax=uncultured Methanobrevibacter sp. TaxID=253161 RepID=UPI0032096416
MTKFDLEHEIQQLEISNMLKNGFKFHIKEFNIKITSKKELNEKLNEFKNANVGGV